jgi:predicted dehydrogenase
LRPLEPLQVEMDDFCRSIHTGETPRSSAEVGVEVVRMIEAVDASLGAQGARIALDQAVRKAAA